MRMEAHFRNVEEGVFQIGNDRNGIDYPMVLVL